MAFRRGNQQRGGGGRRPPLEYVFTGTTYREVNGEKVEDANEEWQLAVTIPVVTKKGNRPLEELIQRLTEIADTNGELGARVVMYVSPRQNDSTGEEFAATNILIQPKLPAKPQGGRGGGGGFRGRSQGGGGRRSYPPQRPQEPEYEEEEGAEEEQAAAPPPRRAAAPAKPATKAAPPKKQAPPPQDDDGPPEYTEDNVPL